MMRTLPISGEIHLTLVLLMLASLLTANPGLTFFSIFSLILLVFLVWRPGEPPILLLALTLQWLQASAMVFKADFFNEDILTMTQLLKIEEAVFLSLVGVLVLALGIRLFIGNIQRNQAFSSNPNQPVLMLFVPARVFAVFLGVIIVVDSLGIIARYIPGLTQQIEVLGSLKYILLYVLCYTIFRQKTGYWYIVASYFIIIAASLYEGAWASWKEPTYMVALGYLTVHARIRLSVVVKLMPLFLFLLYLSVVWSVHKSVMRAGFETADQRVDAIGNMLTSGADLEVFGKGLEILVDRVQYVDYLAKVMTVVPQYEAHTNGSLWLQAVSHVLQPRIFFPNKPPLDGDSIMTARYTHERVAGTEEGESTSIGLGCFAYSYIDFGPIGMFMPVFMLGLLAGLTYRYFMRRAYDQITAYGIIAAIFIGTFSSIATSNVKIVGGFLMSFIVLALLERFVGKAFIEYCAPSVKGYQANSCPKTVHRL